jgi:hypothetical protein
VTRAPAFEEGEHRTGRGEEEELVGPGLVGIPDDHGARCEEGRAEGGGSGVEHAKAKTPGEQDAADGAEDAGEAEDPDVAVAPLAEAVGAGGIAEGGGGGALDPVDEGGLVESWGVADARDDVIAGLEHGARGLGEAGFVAIDRGDGPEAGEIHCQAEHDERNTRTGPGTTPRADGRGGGVRAWRGLPASEEHAREVEQAHAWCGWRHERGL